MKWRFAIRYLTARKSHSVINIIATVTLFAVVVPVAAMVILLSVFNGFESLVRDLYKAVDADIEVRSKGSIEIGDYELRERISKCEGVAELSYIIERQALLSYRDNQITATIRGVDSTYHKVVPINDFISLGDAIVELGEIDRILLGEGVAYDLGLYSTAAGDIEMMALGGSSIGSLIPTSSMQRIPIDVCGTFIIDQQHASSLCITSFRAAEQLFARQGLADAILIKAEEGVSHKDICNDLKSILGNEFEVVARSQKNESFYAIMRYEKWGIFFISLLVLIVASLSIIGTMVMLIIEKRDERRTLLSIGADTSFIRGIFIREGLLISGLGGVIGIVLGVAITLIQYHFGIIKMPNGNFLVENYPVELQLGDIIAVFVVMVAIAMAISMLATSTMIKTKSSK